MVQIIIIQSDFKMQCYYICHCQYTIGSFLKSRQQHGTNFISFILYALLYILQICVHSYYSTRYLNRYLIYFTQERQYKKEKYHDSQSSLSPHFRDNLRTASGIHLICICSTSTGIQSCINVIRYVFVIIQLIFS